MNPNDPNTQSKKGATFVQSAVDRQLSAFQRWEGDPRRLSAKGAVGIPFAKGGPRRVSVSK